MLGVFKTTKADIWFLIKTTSPKEWSGPSRDECLHHPHPPQCAFSDIGQFLVPPLQAVLADLRGGELLESKLKPLIAQGLGVKPNPFDIFGIFLWLNG